MILSYLVLIVPFLIGAGLGRLLDRPGWAVTGGVLGTSLCFILFGILHFTATDIVVLMLPEWVPGRLAIVLVTGVIEIALGVAIMVPRWRVPAGWACIFLLFLFFPANIHTFLAQVGVPGHGTLLEFLAVRTTFQIAMIVWTWWFAVRMSRVQTT